MLIALPWALRQFLEIKVMQSLDHHAGHPERKDELDRTVDNAIQRLVEEAQRMGWPPVECLTALVVAAENRLSSIGGKPVLDAAGPNGGVDPGSEASEPSPS